MVNKEYNLLIIGKNSYIGRNLYNYLSKKQKTTICDFSDFLRDDLTSVNSVLNCCFDNRLFSSAYDRSLDLDRMAIEHINKQNPRIKYIMLSSRTVYQPRVSPPLTEMDIPNPSSIYGQNKRIIEKNLLSMAKDSLLLRISNVIGNQDINRKTFAATALRSLINTGEIKLDIPSSSVKDFIPIDDLSQSVEKLLQGNASGIFNVGSGAKTSVGEVANTIIKSYGSGHLVQVANNQSEDFLLNTSKLKEITRYEISHTDVIKCLMQWVKRYK
ncbi:SDR family oxidoreductase [Kiloniella majae]|uniref:SDR family oxidoreductase n=1 Tax=Kiloniella majae TaxID=1938558 RepID=UPI0015C513FC|nr:SDR family oxidoreductase [Kiloniella majae]